MKKMKFLVGALSLLTAAFMVSPAQAQIKTYLKEDFSKDLDRTVWDLTNSTEITKGVPLYFVQLSQGNLSAGWAYDPGKQIFSNALSDTLGGTYEFIARPIQLENDALNIVSIDYDWYSIGTYAERTFGIRIKAEEDQEWSEVEKIELTKKEMSSTIVAQLDQEWNGKKVVLEFYFTTPNTKGAAYYLMMDNILFGAYSQTPSVATEITSAQFLYGTSADISMRISNTGGVAVTEAKFVYSMDDSEKVDTVTVPFTPAISPISGKKETVATIKMDGLSFTQHTMKLRPVKINGIDVTADSIEWKFYLADESKLTQQYVPLFEGFTSSTCPPCATFNGYFNPIFKTLGAQGAINVIKYQMNFPGSGDPYYISGNRNRMIFYDDLLGWGGQWGVPAPIYNGMEEIMNWNGYYWSDLTDMLTEKATAAHKQKALMSIDITKASIDNAGTLTLSFDITSGLSVKGNVLAVVVEKTTTGNKRTNGEKEFHNVTMAFADGAAGKGVSTEFENSKKETFNYTVDITKTKTEEMTDLAVICFVQHESGYIFQSVMMDVDGKDAPAVANEEDVMGDVRVYPNPAFENVNITNLDGADVEIFDLTGRRVYVSNNVNGDLQIATSAFAQGSYVVRLTKDGKSAHRKLVVVK